MHKTFILGLSPKDIDFENNIIHIRNGVVRENVFTADGKKVETCQIVLGPLKTHKSKRDIPINDITASLLRKYKLQQTYIKKLREELLGHSTVIITMDTYSHVMPEQKKEAMERIKGIV